MADLTPDQAIERLRKLPEDKQRLVLGKLSPEERKGILAKLKTPAAPPGVISRMASSFGGAIAGAAKGMYHGMVEGPQNPEEAKVDAVPITGPIDLRIMRMITEPMKQQAEQAKSEFKQADAITPWTSMRPTPLAVQHRELALGHAMAAAMPMVGPWAAQVGEQIGGQIASGDYAGAVGTLGGNAALYAAPKVVGKGAALALPALRSASESLRTGMQRGVGAGERPVMEEVGKQVEAAGVKQEEVRGKNKAADEAARKTWGETEKAKAKQLEDERQERIAHKKSEDAVAEKHATDKAKIEQQNAAALRDIGKRKVVEQNLESTSHNLDRKIEAAEPKADAEDRGNYDAIRKGTAGFEEDIEPLKQIVKTAKKQANPATSALFGSILKEGEEEGGDVAGQDEEGRPVVNGEPRKVEVAGLGEVQPSHPRYAEFYKAQYGEDPPALQPVAEVRRVVVNGQEVPPSSPEYPQYYEAQYGEPPPLNEAGGATTNFARLQRWYSYINDRMFSGSDRIEPGTYNALRMTRDAINNAMQSLVEKAGDIPDPKDATKTVKAADLLKNAREFHEQKMEAFHDSPNEPQTAATDLQSKVTPDYMKAKKTAAQIKLLARYDNSIPALVKQIESLRAGLKALPEEGPLREKITVPPPAPEPTPAPKPQPLPEPPAPGKNVNRPIVKPPVDTAQIRRGLIEQRAKKWGITGYDVAILGSGIVGDMLGAVFGHPGEAFRGAAFSYVGTKGAIQWAMNNPKFIEWLAKAPKSEVDALAKIPGIDRVKIVNTINEVVKESAAKGKPLPVAPALAAFLGAGAAQPKSLKDLRGEADKHKAPAPAPGPQSQVKHHTHIFDEERGMIVPA